MDRAWSTLTLKGVDEESRTIEGQASTPSVDRMGDVVEPLGARFSLPMPLLWQHKHDTPVGHVEYAQPQPGGIPFRARLAKIDEPGELKNSVDKAWQAVKAGLVRGVSIGFSPIEHERIKDGGLRFKAWDWLELSLVTIPANIEATITTIKSIDAETLAASGRLRSEVTTRAGASAASKPVSLKGNRTMAKKSISEQIAALEASRQAKAGRMQEIQEKAAEEDRTKNDGEREEFDDLDNEIDSIDRELADLRRLEKALVTTAKAVVGHNSQGASESREPRQRQYVTYMRDNLPPGIAYTRYAMCLIASKMDEYRALKMAETHYPDMPVLHNVLRAQSEGKLMTRAAVPPLQIGDPATSPSAQYQMITGDFINYLMPQTIVGKLGMGNVPGPYRVPFNIKVPRQTAPAKGWWVGETKPKPVTGISLDTVQLGVTKVANIVAVSEEFFQFAQFNAEQAVLRSMSEALVYTIDSSFIDPANAGVPLVQPPSITHGSTAIPSTGGTDFDAARADLAAAISALGAAELPYGQAVWIMNSTAASSLMLMTNALSQPAFPGFTPEGGLLLGRPVIVSNTIVSAGTPPKSIIVLVIPSEIYLADDGGVSMDMSREASLELSDTPTGTAASVSLWQTNMVGMRAERFINWTMRRQQACQYITGVGYVA